ncbi:hypothetical protein KFU94_60540 [Chloroflexi bacterium TSY]|nr:hypothetical protein [Chloroflexi bacterium TSY]
MEVVVFEETAQINKTEYPMPLLAWQLHLRSVVDVAQSREDEQSAKLSSELGQHLWQIGDYEGALPYFKTVAAKVGYKFFMQTEGCSRISPLMVIFCTRLLP